MDTARQRLLRGMPLHAITSAYGTDGLRDRFAAEIAGFPHPRQVRLAAALDLAARLHAADRRQQEPYLNHLLRVAIRILSHYEVQDADVAVAALLHDAVEDHAVELAADGTGPAARAELTADGTRQAALAALAARFGGRVADLVEAVTNPEYEPGRDRNQQYREHVADSLDRSPWARIIKASDFTDNGAALIHTTGPEVERLAAKYAPLIPVLRDAVTRPDTPLSSAARQRILAQLDRCAERFAVILPPGPPPGNR
jgi:hypothetical protein